jgi:hypothetical protein
VLRIRLSTAADATGYTIPPDNLRAEVWAYGLRYAIHCHAVKEHGQSRCIKLHAVQALIWTPSGYNPFAKLQKCYQCLHERLLLAVPAVIV